MHVLIAMYLSEVSPINYNFEYYGNSCNAIDSDVNDWGWKLVVKCSFSFNKLKVKSIGNLIMHSIVNAICYSVAMNEINTVTDRMCLEWFWYREIVGSEMGDQTIVCRFKQMVAFFNISLPSSIARTTLNAWKYACHKGGSIVAKFSSFQSRHWHLSQCL